MSDPSFSTRERTWAQVWQGLRFPSDPGCLPHSQRRVSGSFSGPGMRVIPGGKVQPLIIQSRGDNQPPSPLPSLVARAFAWAGAWLGRGGVIKGSEPDRKPSLSRQPLQPPPQPPPGLRWVRNGARGLGEGACYPDGPGRVVVMTGPPLRPGQRRIYWLLPVCRAVGLGP